MIRSLDDLKSNGWSTLEFLLALGLLWAGNAIGSALPGHAFLTEAIGSVVGFFAGALLPSLILGRPTLELRWRIDDLPASGTVAVDLRHRQDPEVYFVADLHATYSSVFGRHFLRRAVKKGVVVVVEFRPLAVIRVKEQQQNVGSQLVGTPATPVLHLSVIDHHHDRDQTRFTGSIVPGGSTASVEDVGVNVDARLADGVTTIWWAHVITTTGCISVRK